MPGYGTFCSFPLSDNEIEDTGPLTVVLILPPVNYKKLRSAILYQIIGTNATMNLSTWHSGGRGSGKTNKKMPAFPPENAGIIQRLSEAAFTSLSPSTSPKRS